MVESNDRLRVALGLHFFGDTVLLDQLQMVVNLTIDDKSKALFLVNDWLMSTLWIHDSKPLMGQAPVATSVLTAAIGSSASHSGRELGKQCLKVFWGAFVSSVWIEKSEYSTHLESFFVVFILNLIKILRYFA